jgi:hypothetical protein
MTLTVRVLGAGSALADRLLAAAVAKLGSRFSRRLRRRRLAFRSPHRSRSTPLRRRG